jgi:hypothetical protein
MKTSAAEHLRTVFRRHAWQFDDRESWPIDTLGRFSGDSLLQHTVMSGSVKDVKLVIRHGANVNVLGDMGFTALHYATRCESPDIAEALLDAGADVSIRNEFGRTPLESLKGREPKFPPKVFKKFVKLLSKRR